MRRRLLNFFTVVSLVLCIATAALAIRSCWRVDNLYVGRARVSDDVRQHVGFEGRASLGVLWLELGWGTSTRAYGPHWPAQPSAPWTWEYKGSEPRPMHTGYDVFWGVEWRRSLDRRYADGPVNHTISNLTLRLPLGFVLVPSAALPAWSLCTSKRRRRKYRLARRLCLACAYDLTGNVSGTCPECGAATSGATHAA